MTASAAASSPCCDASYHVPPVSGTDETEETRGEFTIICNGERPVFCIGQHARARARSKMGPARWFAGVGRSDGLASDLLSPRPLHLLVPAFVIKVRRERFKSIQPPGEVRTLVAKRRDPNGLGDRWSGG